MGGMEGAFKDNLVQPLHAMGRDTFHQIRLLKAPSNLTLNTSNDGASRISMGKRKGNMDKLEHGKFQFGIRGKNPDYQEGGQTLEQVAQRGCGIPILGDVQNLIRHDPEHLI